MLNGIAWFLLVVLITGILLRIPILRRLVDEEKALNKLIEKLYLRPDLGQSLKPVLPFVVPAIAGIMMAKWQPVDTKS